MHRSSVKTKDASSWSCRWAKTWPLPPQDDVVQIHSTEGGPPTKHTAPEKRKPNMKSPSVPCTTNGNPIGQPKTDPVAVPGNGNGINQPKNHPVTIPEKVNATGLDALLAEAETLK